MPQKYDRETLELLVSGPDVRAQQYVAAYKKKLTHAGLSWGIPEIDDKVLPMRPGDLVGIVARPGHAKTAMLAWHAKREAYRLLSEGKENSGVFVCSWETTAEEYEAYMISDQDITISRLARGMVPEGDVTRTVAQKAKLPIYFIGRSQAHAGFKTPNMTMDVVENLLDLIYTMYDVKPTLILFDYLQIIPVDGVTNKTEQVEVVTPWVKRMAQTVDAPAFVAAQAARKVDTYKWKIPEKDDCQHSSVIEQVADKLFGLWRTCLTEPREAEPLEIYPGKFVDPTDKNLVVMKMLKQRDEEGVWLWPLSFNMPTRTLGVFRAWQ